LSFEVLYNGGPMANLKVCQCETNSTVEQAYKGFNYKQES